MPEDRDRVPSFPGSGKTIVLPDLGAPTADTHAHLDMLADPVGALVRAARAGVTLVCSIVDLTEEPEVTFDGLSGWLARAADVLDADCVTRGGGEDSGGPGLAPPDVRLILGVHPHNASHYDAATHERLRALATSMPPGLVVGLGEMGLDFHYDHSPRDDQRDAFRRQLVLAGELGLPVTVHLRAAHAEGLEIIREVGVPAAGLIIHCFTEGPETAEAFLALSPAVVLSLAGPVTFVKAQQIRDALAFVPLDRMLAETDSPFLAPAPYRGEANEPAFVTVNVARIAEVLGLPATQVATTTYANARRVFRIADAVWSRAGGGA
jgi:TatD DNase family protein